MSKRQLFTIIGVLLTAVSLAGGAFTWTSRSIAADEISKRCLGKEQVQAEIASLKDRDIERHMAIERRLDEIKSDIKDVRSMLIRANYSDGRTAPLALPIVRNTP